MKSNKQPEIRFPGFAGDWEQRKFSEIIKSIQTGTNLLGKTTNNGVPLIKMGNIQRGYFDLNKIEYLSENDEVEENMARYGDFLFNTRNTLLLVGKGATWFGNSDEYAFNSNIARFIFKEINTIFFNYLYNTPEVIKQVQARAVGTTSVAAVYPRDLNSLIFSIPTLQEQEEIGTFFKSLDNTIALHQQELMTLKETKQGLLQKMFPKEGEKVPEIRFPEFTGDWEQRKLGEESDVRDGTHSSPKYFDSGYPLITSKNLKYYGLDMTDVSFISHKDFEAINQRSKVDKGDILFGMIGTIGNPVLINRDNFAIKNVALIKEKKNVLNRFLIQLLKSPIFDKYIENEMAGGTQKFLSLSKIRSFIFRVPSTKEQVSISNFLGQLDDTIALHQRELDLLKETKKAFLQKMFI